MWSIKGQLEAIIYCQVNKNTFQLDVDNLLFPKLLSGTLSDCQTVGIQIRTNGKATQSGSQLFALTKVA